VALAVFGAIIWYNYNGLVSQNEFGAWRRHYQQVAQDRLKVQLLVLAVGYVGFFSF
jgi:hypothetical protein